MRKYFGVNLLGKIRVGFVLQKRAKKRGKSTVKSARKMFFTHKRTQFAALFGGEPGRNWDGGGRDPVHDTRAGGRYYTATNAVGRGIRC